MCSLQTQKVCGAARPAYPAPRQPDAPAPRWAEGPGRLAAGRCPRLARESTPRPPTPKSPRPAQALSGPQSPRAPACSDLGSQAPGSQPRGPSTPNPLASANPAPSVGGFPEAQARSLAFPVAVSAPGRPTQPGQRGDSAEISIVRDRSSSSEPAGPRRKLPLAPPTRRSRRRLDLVRGRAGTGPRAIGESSGPLRHAGPPPHRRLFSGGSAGRRRAGQSGPYCCCVIGARRRPLVATSGTTRRAREGQGLMDSWTALGEAVSLRVTVGSRGARSRDGGETVRGSV